MFKYKSTEKKLFRFFSRDVRVTDTKDCIKTLKNYIFVGFVCNNARCTNIRPITALDSKLTSLLPKL